MSGALASMAVLIGWLSIGAQTDYLVVLDDDGRGELSAAAKAMAAIHNAAVRTMDVTDDEALLEAFRAAQPRYVVFVLPHPKIDVDLSHTILELATRVDDDPFVDFEYGFVTGRDGKAALRFVRQIEKAWARQFTKRAAMFGSWEGMFLPPKQPLPVMTELDFKVDQRFVKTNDSEVQRRKVAREALTSFADRDVLLFFSHGYPDEMASCFRANDLRQWNVQFSPSVLVNCACFNGAPGRWFNPMLGHRFQDRGLVDPEASVALQILDSGLAGYIAGIDSWHGPLANQLFLYITDDGMRLGEATKRMWDRLALAFLPERIHYAPTREVTFRGEGRENRLRNGAGMILYGDPKLAPFAKTATRHFEARLDRDKAGRRRVRLGFRPLYKGPPGVDFMLPQARLMDYYSVRTSDVLAELKTEIYAVVELPEGTTTAPALKVRSARSARRDVATGKPQVVIETTPASRLLHVRVPLEVPVFPALALINMATNGLTIELSE